jgi:hypothetical protein
MQRRNPKNQHVRTNTTETSPNELTVHMQLESNTAAAAAAAGSYTTPSYPLHRFSLDGFTVFNRTTKCVKPQLKNDENKCFCAIPVTSASRNLTMHLVRATATRKLFRAGLCHENI